MNRDCHSHLGRKRVGKILGDDGMVFQKILWRSGRVMHGLDQDGQLDCFVGYVGMMKSRLGVKMRNPNLWRKLENGTGGNSEVRSKSLEIENEYDARGEGDGDGQ